MKAKSFPEANTVFAKDDPNYGPIPAYMDNSINGHKDVVLSYGFSFWERIMILLTGRVWITITTFNGVLKPIWLTTFKRQLLTSRKQRRDKEKAMKKTKKPVSIPPPGEGAKVLN